MMRAGRLRILTLLGSDLGGGLRLRSGKVVRGQLGRALTMLYKNTGGGGRFGGAEGERRD